MKAILVLFLLIMPGLLLAQQADGKSNFSQKKNAAKIVAVKNPVAIQRAPVQQKSNQNIEAYRKLNNVPDDFPRYINTGNEKADEETYYNAKQEWIRKNPERFETIKHLNL